MTRTSIARLADDAPVPRPESWPARDRPTLGKYRTYHGGQGPKDWPASKAVAESQARISALHGGKS